MQAIIKVMLNAADLSSAVKDFPCAQKWAKNHQQELFLQGDHETKLGLTTSPMCDRLRDRSHFASSQEEHLRCVVLPVFDLLGLALPTVAAECVPAIKGNQTLWKREIALSLTSATAF